MLLSLATSPSYVLFCAEHEYCRAETINYVEGQAILQRPDVDSKVCRVVGSQHNHTALFTLSWPTAPAGPS
jgi:hypothetical protein